MKKSRVYLLVYFLVCILVIHFVSDHYPSIYFGKEDGMVFQILSTWLASWFAFFFIERTFLRYFIELVIAFVCYAATYFIYYILYNELNLQGLNIPIIADNIIAFFFVYLFGLSRIKKNARSR